MTNASHRPFVTSPETTANVTRLTAYFGSKPDGAELSWLDIERDTSIRMRAGDKGRAHARKALSKLGRVYETMVGFGIRLSSATRALDIVRHDFRRAGNGLKRAAKKQRLLADRHLQQMTPQDRDQMLRAEAIFGTMRALAKENAQRLLK